MRAGIGAPNMRNGTVESVSNSVSRLDTGVWVGLEGLWEEELEVVSAVLGRIERGETDW